MVELEEGQERVYFRFYDPWVLRVFWETSDAEQRRKAARGIENLIVEDNIGVPHCLVEPRNPVRIAGGD